MAVTLDGSAGTITGLATLPDGTVNSDDIADGAITLAKLTDPGVVKTYYDFNTPRVFINTTAWVDVVSTTYTPLYNDSVIYVYFNINFYYSSGKQSSDSRGRLLVDGSQFFINERVVGNVDGDGSQGKHTHFDSWSSFNNNTTNTRTITLQGTHNSNLSGNGVDFGHGYLQYFYIKEVKL